MDSTIEVISTITVGNNKLTSIGAFTKPGATSPGLCTILTEAWRVYTEHTTTDTGHWGTIEVLLKELDNPEMMLLVSGDTRRFAAYYEGTRYLLEIGVREYQSVKEENSGGIMAWISDVLFGRKTIRRQPEDLNQHPGAKSDLDKPVYEQSYQRAYFNKLTADWQAINGESNPVDDNVDAKALTVGDRIYLIRGAAALVPDTVLWAFLSHMWTDCVRQWNYDTGLSEKTLTYSVKLCLSRDVSGIYTDPTMPLTMLSPINNKYSNTELDVTVGPAMMDRLSKLFALGEILCLNERGASGVNTLTSFGYKVVGGPQNEPGYIFTRLGKIE